MGPQQEAGERVLEDEGEADKRLLVIEPELATVLRRMQGETNTLSPVIREAWESGNLSTLTKNTPLKATGAHVKSIIAHSTREELVTSLTETDRGANGRLLPTASSASLGPALEAFAGTGRDARRAAVAADRRALQRARPAVASAPAA
mgnify:CR=1 FL=1